MSTCSECERLRRELAETEELRAEGAAKNAALTLRLAEARKDAFIEAAEIAGKLLTADLKPQQPGFLRGVGYAAQFIFDELRAKAEETRT